MPKRHPKSKMPMAQRRYRTARVLGCYFMSLELGRERRHQLRQITGSGKLRVRTVRRPEPDMHKLTLALVQLARQLAADTSETEVRQAPRPRPSSRRIKSLADIDSAKLALVDQLARGPFQPLPPLNRLSDAEFQAMVKRLGLGNSQEPRT